MPLQLKDLTDKTKYKNALKAELNGLDASPANFHYFEKFKFDDGRLGPLLLVGAMMRKDLFEAVKDTDALIKAKGKCSKAAATGIEFVPEMGSLPVDKLKPDMSGIEAKVVAKPSTPGTAAPVDDANLKDPAAAKLALLTKQFDAIKARMTDEERKAVRITFGKIEDAMKAGKYGEAMAEMKNAEAANAKAGNAVRQDAVQGATGAYKEAEKGAIARMDEAERLKKEVEELAAEIKKTEQAAGVASAKRSNASQQKGAELQKTAQELKKRLDTLKAGAIEATKASGPDAAALKPLLAKVVEIQTKYDGIAKALAAPGKISDNAELKGAQDAIKGKVGEMSDATRWQQSEVKAAQGGANKHGTGRHGAQTGLESQAQRIASDVTPDQAHNEGGTAQLTAQWKTTIKWTKNPDGTRKITEPAKIVSTVVDELNRTLGTSTSSMFLNPVLEKEAVDRALDIAKNQCKWTEWNDGTNWKPLLSLTIVVPPPKTAQGYGLSAGKGEGFVKKAATDAAALVKDFETGKIKTIDELMEKLNVQLTPDRTGVGAAMIRHARVVLSRSAANAAWTNKTQFPTPDAPSWEVAKNVSLTGRTVRAPGVAASVAPNYTV
jgi:hypothetical protein